MAAGADEIWPAISSEDEPAPLTAGERDTSALDRLPADVRPQVEALLREVTVEELTGMVPVLDVHVSDIETAAHSDPAIDASTAVALREALINLIKDAHELGARERSLVAAAASYFALRHDRHDDHTARGLHDDMTVVNAVCRAVGRDDLQVRISPTER